MNTTLKLAKANIISKFCFTLTENQTDYFKSNSFLPFFRSDWAEHMKGGRNVLITGLVFPCHKPQTTKFFLENLHVSKERLESPITMQYKLLYHFFSGCLKCTVSPLHKVSYSQLSLSGHLSKADKKFSPCPISLVSL